MGFSAPRCYPPFFRPCRDTIKTSHNQLPFAPSWTWCLGGQTVTLTGSADCPRLSRGCQSPGGGMGWATTSALGGWPLVRSPSVDDSAVSRYSRSAFGPVPLSRSDAHGIGRGGHYQGRHLPFHQGPATHTPRDERTELVSFHRSSMAPHAPPYPARRTVGLDRSLAVFWSEAATKREANGGPWRVPRPN